MTFITNIKVIKDPLCPENEGKIFLYAMSGKMKDKIQSYVDPSEQDRALGATPKEMFNPLQGNNFRLCAKIGSNNQTNYDSSEVVSEVTSIYNSVEEALEDIKNNTYKLSDLLKPESFLSYEELQNKMKWVTFQDATPSEQKPAVKVAEPLAADLAPNKTQTPEVRSVDQNSQEPEVKTPDPVPSKSESLEDLIAQIK